MVWVRIGRGEGQHGDTDLPCVGRRR
jgi:hypothetical protein